MVWIMKETKLKNLYKTLGLSFYYILIEFDCLILYSFFF